MSRPDSDGLVRRRLSRPTGWILDCLLDDPTREWSGMQLARANGIPSGTVYPILARLEANGWLQSRWQPHTDHGQPARRLYRLDAHGAVKVRQALAATTTGLTWGAPTRSPA